MKQKLTFGNNILVRLEKGYDEITLNSGKKLYLDTSYEPEKHAPVVGEVFGLPSKLTYTGKPNQGMPWKTDLELQIGDRVVMYYLAVVNAFKKEIRKSFEEDGYQYIFIQYQNVFARVRDGKITPVNGYCLVEPIENPEWARIKARMMKLGLEPIRFMDKSQTDVVYGKVVHCGNPNHEYVDGYTDNGVNIVPGNVIVMKRISDVPTEYPLHARIDGGRRYWRVQRKNILAIYEKPVC